MSKALSVAEAVRVVRRGRVLPWSEADATELHRAALVLASAVEQKDGEQPVAWGVFIPTSGRCAALSTTPYQQADFPSAIVQPLYLHPAAPQQDGEQEANDDLIDRMLLILDARNTPRPNYPCEDHVRLGYESFLRETARGLYNVVTRSHPSPSGAQETSP